MNTCKALTDWIAEHFGGYVSVVRPKDPKHHKYYQWVLSGSKAEILASWLVPYLIVKSEQVKRILPGC